MTTRHPHALVWALSLLFVVVGCGGDDTPSFGGGDGDELPGPGDDPDALAPIASPDAGAPAPDVGAPGAGSDTGGGGPGADVPEGMGAPCEGPEDCLTGFCADTPLGALCTELCTGTCPGGWVCALAVDEGGGFIQYCVPAFPRLCWPCLSNDDCNVAGLPTAQRCVDFGAAGAFCGGDCAEQGCPLGFSCEERVDVGGAAVTQCVPLTGVCACSPDAIAAQAETSCARENEWGRCDGLRRCEPEGLTGCDAPEPQPEVCNGLDDDCDGLTDEVEVAESCIESNQHGACAGKLACVGGRFACDAPTPAPEACSGVDEDCDGLTDEEGAAGCTPRYADHDGDGYGAGAPRCLCQPSPPYTAAVGGDCDDDDPSVNPGAAEVCNGKDDNCSGGPDEPGAEGCTLYLLDADGDGWGATGQQACLCAPSGPYADVPPGDCNDNVATIYPGAPEVCNGKDDSCDGVADPPGSEGCVVYWRDEDGDGFGITGDSQCLCTPLVPYTAISSGDCDDANPTVKPGQTEVCNGVDDDCDGIIDPPGAVGCTLWWRDEDGDGFGLTGDFVCACGPAFPYTAPLDGDCDDGDAQVVPGQQETCNGIDDDCNGLTDEAGALGCALFYADGDGDGWGDVTASACLCAAEAPFTSAQFGDCDDEDPSVFPGAAEVCNGVDDNCNGAIDEPGAEGCVVFYNDGDGDGWGTDEWLCLCGPTGDFTATKPGDCDDDDAKVSPDRPEVCNGIDDNCDGIIDGAGALGCAPYFMDSDGDGFGASGTEQCLCGPEGDYVAVQGGDCDDADPAVSPAAAEVCNGVDDDCDGVVDEGCGLPVIGWPTYGADVRRTSQSMLEQGPTANKALWSVALDSPAVGSVAILPDRRVAAVTAGSVHLVSPQGALLWSQPLPAPALGAAGPTARLGGTLVVGASERVALYSPAGALLWDVSTAGGPITSAPIVDNAGRIFALGSTGLTRLDGGGEVAWSTAFGPGVTSAGAPAINPNGAILVATSQGGLRAFAATTGEQLWHFDSGAPSGTGALTIGATGISYFGTSAGVRATTINGGSLYTLNLSSAPLGLAVFNTAYQCCVPQDQILATTAQNSGLYKRSANLSSSIYQKSPGSPWPAVTDYDGDTYLTTNAGTLVRLNLAGNVQWTFTPAGGAKLVTPPAISPGVVIVGDDQGVLHARGD